MSVKIKIVNLGNKIGAVKLGKCPMFSITDKENKENFIAGIKEDLPGCIIEDGEQKERQALAQFIIRSKQR